jgi:excisionase family DNA binding protein
MTGEPEWLDVEAAARFLNLRPNTIYRLINDGQLPALRFPVRIRREDLEACLERCRILPGELAHFKPIRRP